MNRAWNYVEYEIEDSDGNEYIDMSCDNCFSWGVWFEEGGLNYSENVIDALKKLCRWFNRYRSTGDETYKVCGDEIYMYVGDELMYILKKFKFFNKSLKYEII